MMLKQRHGTRSDSVLRMTDTLETFAATSQDDHAARMLGMAAKALTQLQSHNDTVMAEAVDWKDKYEEMGQLFRELVGELEEEVEDLAEENEQLRVKYQEREVPLLIDCFADKNDLLARENMSAEAPLQQTTITNSPRKNSFSGDVYNQLDEFEHSLDMELEAFQRLELLTDELEHSLDKELDTMAPVQLTLEPSKGMLKTLTRKPFQLLRRAFQAQDDEPMPALTTSDSLFSLSSNCSMSEASSQDLLGFAPAGKMTRMSPGPNAEWGIMA